MNSQSDTLQAAVMQLDITPPIGVPMGGYGARTGTSNAVHDPLFASLLVLKTETSGIALISLDLLAVTLDFTNRVRSALSPVLGIPETGILVSATHTHSGPAGFLGKVPMLREEDDPFLKETILRKLVGAAAWTSSHLQPASLSTSVGNVQGIGLNRNDPHTGLVDHQVVILRVDDLNGSPLAVLTNYGCHPTVLGPENLALSAEFPGAARAILNEIYPRTVFLFANGATGDVSTRFTRRGQGFAEVERLGSLLAGETLKLMQVASPGEPTPLWGRVSPVNLTIRQFPSIQAAEEQLAMLLTELEQMQVSGKPHGEIRRAVTRVEGAQAQLVMSQSYAGISSVETQVQVLRIGPLALMAIPGEPFSSTVLDMKARSLICPIMVVSYANDYRGYFPDSTSIAAGTYEALTSPYDEQASSLLAQTLFGLLN